MKEVVDALKAVVGELVTFLRYLAAPLVAALVVWLADEDHNIFYFAGSSSTVVGNQAAWFWIVLASLALLGISEYSFHRDVIVPFIGERIHKRLTEGKGQPTLDDLSFARWERRAAKIDTPVGMAQKVLDQANAAGDFLYCSSLCILALVGSFVCFSGRLQMSAIRCLALIAVAAVFAWAGFVQHRHTARLDLQAYNRGLNA